MSRTALVWIAMVAFCVVWFVGLLTIIQKVAA